MKVFKKRVIAFIADIFLICSILVVCDEVLSSFFVNVSRFDIFILLFLVSFKDCIFINASLGKKIMGLRIYDSNWEKPKLFHSIKRTLATYFLAPFMIFRSYVSLNGPDYVDKLGFFNLEKNVLKSFVIDKKVYKKLKADAEGMDGNFADNMTELYMMYLRDIYSK